MQHLLVSLSLVAALVLPGQALASPGRTNAQGCHVCHSRCAAYGLSVGELHCHSKWSPVLSAQAKGINDPVVAETHDYAVISVVLLLLVLSLLYWRLQVIKKRT